MRREKATDVKRKSRTFASFTVHPLSAISGDESLELHRVMSSTRSTQDNGSPQAMTCITSLKEPDFTPILAHLSP